MRLVPCLLVACACGCGGAAGGGAVVVPVGASTGAVATSAPVEAPAPPPKLPADYVEVTVAGVVPSPEGDSVLLTESTHETIVPISIGGTEALSIALRFGKRRYERPLTHDLLDAVMRELGGELVRVQIDDLRDDVFLATIVLRHEGRYTEVDARPSDAIALAIGNRAPIYMSKRVLKSAGLNKNELDDGDVPHGAGGADAGAGVLRTIPVP